MDGPEPGTSYEEAYIQFALFTVVNLRSFLSKRGWTGTGTKELLIAKCISAWARGDAIVPTLAEKHVQNERDYK